MQKVAIIVSNGSFNNLINVATIVRAATASDMAVRVFFRDEAVLKLTREKVNEVNLSEAYRGMEDGVMERLRSADFESLQQFLRDSKEHGDDVKFYACTSSMHICGVKEEDLIPEIDEARPLSAFLLEDASEADAIMTF